MYPVSRLPLLLFLMGVLLSCQQKHPTDSWQISFIDTGTNSSPQAVDLNQDGVLDIVMGGGAREWMPSVNGVLALDGKSGEMLWHVPARNQIVGSAHFQELTGDAIPDVIIGGRSAQLLAIDGSNGAIIWEFMPDDGQIDFRYDTAVLNFFNPQSIPDQDGDGLPELLIAYGGFVEAPPYDSNRPAGKLLVISAKTGKTLVTAPMPEGKETYMSPLVHDFEGNGQLEVIFGTGGETLAGKLYRIPLAELLKGDLSAAKVLASSATKGFVAPCALADTNGDGIKDIACNTIDGRFLLLDGKTDQLLWKIDLGRSYESYSVPAPGFFNQDGTPDFFVSFGEGQWPNIDHAVQLAVDGKDGSLLLSDSTGFFQYASPVVFDFSGDGLDDVLFVVNQRVSSQKPASLGLPTVNYANNLLIYDVAEGEVRKMVTEPFKGTNLGSTPLLTDLDADGLLDLVFCRMTDHEDFFAYRHLVVQRDELPYTLLGQPEWGQYMGKNQNGTFDPGKSPAMIYGSNFLHKKTP